MSSTCGSWRARESSTACSRRRRPSRPYCHDSKRKGYRARPEPVPDGGEVGHRRVVDVSVADGNLLEHELPVAVAGALWRRVGHPENRQLPRVQLYPAAWCRQRRPAGELRYDRLAGEIRRREGLSVLNVKLCDRAVQLPGSGGAERVLRGGVRNAAGRHDDGLVFDDRDAAV